jgi:uncharacterized protein YciI
MNEQEERAMSEHFAYLKSLLSEGRLFLAGPCLDTSFGIVIFEAENDEDANRIMLGDPALRAGVVSAELHQFRISLLRGR